MGGGKLFFAISEKAPKEVKEDLKKIQHYEGRRGEN